MNELTQVSVWSEWCDVEDWKAHHDKGQELHFAWDPVHILPQKVEAGWVFDEDGQNLLFCCGKIRPPLALSSGRYESKVLSQKLFFQIARSVNHVTGSLEIPFSNATSNFLRASDKSELSENDRERLGWYRQNCRLVTTYDGGLKLVLCIPKVGEDFGTSDELSTTSNAAEFVLNYSRYLMKNPTSNLVPDKFLSLHCNSTDKLLEYFWSPKAFDPFKKNDTWIWPWQRMKEEGSFETLGQTTTSLCADIRLSTKAMERTENEADFARYIRKAVIAMRSVLAKYGGFFDKETGDGIVGHFLDDETERNGATSAFLAGREMARVVGDLSKSFVNDSLSQKLPVGLGVGIHTGRAHWFADNYQIRAIGSSVIEATRMCACADAGEVLLSLGAHRNTLQCLSSEEVRVSHLKKVDIKGLDTSVEAYSMEI